MSLTNITPKAFFTLRTEVRKNAHYITDHKIIFPAGSVMVLQNYPDKKQKFINLREKSVFLELMEISPRRKLIAVIQNGKRGQIVIYDLETLKYRKTLNLPLHSKACRFECISFTHDEVFIFAITGEPEWNLLVYQLSKGIVVSSVKATNTSHRATVTQISCSPNDNSYVCLAGQSLLRLLSRNNNVWRQHGIQKVDLLNITSVAWLSGNTVLCGTHNGKLLIVNNGELKNTYNALTAHTINVRKKNDSNAAGSSSLLLIKKKGEEEDDVAVRTIISFSKGFAYSCKSGYVHFFEKETPDQYNKRNVFKIKHNDLKHLPQWKLNMVNHISVNISEDRLLVTTNRAQLYTVFLWEKNIYNTEVPEIPFQHLGESLHHGPINGLATCIWKPYFITSGKIDRTIRLWNYEKETIIFIKYYSEEILSIDLHPTGNFIAVAFHEKIDILIILMNDMEAFQTLPKKECEIIQFSSYGEYLAVIDQEVIEIFGTIWFNKAFTLKRHLGKVTAIEWILDDKQLVSCSSAGEIFIWELFKGTVIGEIQMPEVSFCSIAATSDGNTVFAIDSEGFLKKFSNLNLSSSFKFQQINLEELILSHSNSMMFMTRSNASIVSVKLPIINQSEFSTFHFHMSQIKKLKLSYNDQILVSVSAKGAVILWKVDVSEENMFSVDKKFTYATEFLINKTESENQVLEIKSLSEKVHELEMKQSKELQATEKAYLEQIKKKHEMYMQNVRNLKRKIDLLESNQSKQFMDIKKEVNRLIEEQQKKKEDLIEKYTNKISEECEKVQLLENYNLETINEFEAKVLELEKSKKEIMDDIIENFEEKLAQLEILLQQARQQKVENILKHNVEKGYIEEDADREIVETTTKYEESLKEENERNTNLKEETLILRKKFSMSLKEKHELQQNLQKLQKDFQKYQSEVYEKEKYLDDLKVEIAGRDTALEEKDKKILSMKNQIQESEKLNFVLEYKIKEYKKRIEPREQSIKEKKEQILDMDGEVDILKKLNSSLKLQLIELKEKIHGTEKNKDLLEEKLHSKITAIKRMKTDIYLLYQNIKDFKKLRDGIKTLNYKYHQCDFDNDEKFGTSDAKRDLLVQRMFLERTIKALRNILHKNILQKSILDKSESEKTKLIEGNVLLLEELNSVRRRLTVATKRVTNLEKVTRVKDNEIVAPNKAFNRVEKVLKKQKAIKQACQIFIQGADAEMQNLSAEINTVQKTFIELNSSKKN